MFCDTIIILFALVTQGKIIDRISDKSWHVYALELTDDKYYIGISVNPETRFLEHKDQTKSSSSWCKKYKAQRIIETIDTGLKGMIDATLIEDIYALEYIKRYGSNNVRGGRYLGSDLKVEKLSICHLSRGYITIRHKLLKDFAITHANLISSGAFDYVVNSKNFPYIEKLILETQNSNGISHELLEKITVYNTRYK